MSTNIKFIIWMLITAALASTAFFLFPAAQEVHAEWPLAIAFASSITQIVASWYFISSLRTFKRGLKIAYSLLAAGILVFSLVQLIPSLSVIPELVTLFSDPTLVYALFMTPYAFGALLIYAGVWKFAHLLGVRNVWSSFPAVLVMALAAGGLAIGLLYTTPVLQETLLDRIAFGLMVWCGVFSVAACLVALRIREVIGVTYKNAMKWMAIALAALAFTTFHEFVVKTYFSDSWYVTNQLSLLTFLLVGVLFLKAGLAFKETGREYLGLPANASHVDVVVTVAGRVSKPEAVGEWMDRIRVITSRPGLQKTLSAEDKNVILDTYLRVERYLINDEPLHIYSKEGLRNGLPEAFLNDLSRHETGRSKSAPKS